MSLLPKLDRYSAQGVARGLGLFSLGLGALELLAPRGLARWLGLEGGARLLQAYGLREIGAGVAVLAVDQPRPGVWARVAGDGLDIATLLAAFGRSRRPGAVAFALVAVVGVTALDVICAESLID